MCSLTTAHIYMDSPVGRPFIFVRPLVCTFIYFLVLKSIYDIVSLTKRFVHLCQAKPNTLPSSMFSIWHHQNPEIHHYKGIKQFM